MINKIYELFYQISDKKVIDNYREAYDSCWISPRNTYLCIRASIESLVKLIAEKKCIKFGSESLNEKIDILIMNKIDNKLLEELRSIKNECNNAAHPNNTKFVPDQTNALIFMKKYHNVLFSVAKKYLGLNRSIEFVNPDISAKKRSEIYLDALENFEEESLYLTTVYLEEECIKPEKQKFKKIYFDHLVYFYDQLLYNFYYSEYHHKASYKLALIYLKRSSSFYKNAIADNNETKGLSWLIKSVERRNPDAMNLYAEIIINKGGLFFNGEITEISSAIEYLLESAQSDNYKALHNLMFFYKNGLESNKTNKKYIEVNHKKAFDYCLKAANAGFPDAMFDLALMLKDGFGCKQDTDRSSKWLKMALANDCIRAMVYHLENNYCMIPEQEIKQFLLKLEKSDSITTYYILAKEYTTGKYIYKNLYHPYKNNAIEMLLSIIKMGEIANFNNITEHSFMDLNENDLTVEYNKIDNELVNKSKVLIKGTVKAFLEEADPVTKQTWNYLFDKEYYPFEDTIQNFNDAKTKASKKFDEEIDSYIKRTATHDNVKRNDLCPCESGKKYKKCHGKM